MQQTSAMPHAGFYAIQRRQQQYGSVNNKQLSHNAQFGEHIGTIKNHLTFARCIQTMALIMSTCPQAANHHDHQ
jgi:hypothetical protein